MKSKIKKQRFIPTAISCLLISTIVSPTLLVKAEPIEEGFEKEVFALNTNADDMESYIELYNYEGKYYIKTGDLIHLTDSAGYRGPDNFEALGVSQYNGGGTFNPADGTFKDFSQKQNITFLEVEPGEDERDTEYAVPIEFLEYFHSSDLIALDNKTLYSYMPKYTPWLTLETNLNASMLQNKKLRLCADIAEELLSEQKKDSNTNYDNVLRSVMSYGEPLYLYQNCGLNDYIESDLLKTEDYVFNSKDGQAYIAALGNENLENLNMIASPTEIAVWTYHNNIKTALFDDNDSENYVRDFYNAVKDSISINEEMKVENNINSAILASTVASLAQNEMVYADSANLISDAIGYDVQNALDLTNNKCFESANKFNTTAIDSEKVKTIILESLENKDWWNIVLSNGLNSTEDVNTALSKFVEYLTGMLKQNNILDTNIDTDKVQAEKQLLPLYQLTRNAASVMQALDEKRRDGMDKNAYYKLYLLSGRLLHQTLIAMYQNVLDINEDEAIAETCNHLIGVCSKYDFNAKLLSPEDCVPIDVSELLGEN